MTIVWIILATVAIWKYVLKPIARWAETTSFRGFKAQPARGTIIRNCTFDGAKGDFEDGAAIIIRRPKP